MKMLRITTPEKKAYEMPYNWNTVQYYETANARKKATEVKYKIEEYFDGEANEVGESKAKQKSVENKTPKAPKAPKVPEEPKAPEVPEPQTPETPEVPQSEPQTPEATETQNVKSKK